MERPNRGSRFAKSSSNDKPVALVAIALTVAVVASMAGPAVAVSTDPNKVMGDASDEVDCKVGLAQRMTSSSVYPSIKVCSVLEGECAVAEKPKAETEVTLVQWFWKFVLEIETEVNVTTEVSCEGAWEIGVVHYGGSGPILAESQVVFDEGGDGGAVAPGVPVEMEGGSGSGGVADAEGSCEYLAPQKACKVTLEGPWYANRTFEGRLISDEQAVQACTTLHWRAEDTVDRVLMLGGDGREWNERQVCEIVEYTANEDDARVLGL